VGGVPALVFDLTVQARHLLDLTAPSIGPSLFTLQFALRVRQSLTCALGEAAASNELTVAEGHEDYHARSTPTS
jgi:hypothetical protein